MTDADVQKLIVKAKEDVLDQVRTMFAEQRKLYETVAETMDAVVVATYGDRSRLNDRLTSAAGPLSEEVSP